MEENKRTEDVNMDEMNEKDLQQPVSEEMTEEPASVAEEILEGEVCETDETEETGDTEGTEGADESCEEGVEVNDETSEAGSGNVKKGFFGKRKEKKDKKDIQIEELTDKLKRQMAEFDNFRKRTDKEKSYMYEIGAKEVLEKILPVVDNFERGLAGVKEEEENAFTEGMKMIYKQFITTLEDLGVKSIESVGQEFDLNLHNAVMHVDDEEAGVNTVVEEFQKGYTYKDSVIRHSMVKVAN